MGLRHLLGYRQTQTSAVRLVAGECLEQAAPHFRRWAWTIVSDLQVDASIGGRRQSQADSASAARRFMLGRLLVLGGLHGVQQQVQHQVSMPSRSALSHTGVGGKSTLSSTAACCAAGSTNGTSSATNARSSRGSRCAGCGRPSRRNRCK